MVRSIDHGASGQLTVDPADTLGPPADALLPSAVWPPRSNGHGASGQSTGTRHGAAAPGKGRDHLDPGGGSARVGGATVQSGGGHTSSGRPCTWSATMMR